MTKKHVWRIKKEYFHQLKSGEKNLEVRVGYPQIKKVQQGDTIVFENYDPNEFDVKRISVYDSFKRMLEVEGVDRVLPGMTFYGALRMFQRIYPKDKESLGVYVFKLKFKTNEVPSHEFCKASDLLEADENKKFAKIIAEIYMTTDWICRDYLDHCGHYFIPGIINGKNEIIACTIDNEIIAAAILKKDTEEQRISMLFIKPEYQSHEITTELLEKCFAWLGTTRPAITIASYKLGQFAEVIKKYGWIEKQMLTTNRYDDYFRDRIFNS